MKGLEHRSYEEQLRELKLFSSGETLSLSTITLKEAIAGWVLVSPPKHQVIRRGNGFKLCHGTFRLNIRKKFFSEMVVRHWNGLPREVVELPSLEVFQKCVDVVPSDMV